MSHDRRFLEGVTTRVILVRGGEVEIYPGGFRDYEETVTRRAAAAASARAAEKAAATPPRARAAPVAEARASEPPPARARAVKRSASTRPQDGATENGAPAKAAPVELDPEARRRAFEAEKQAGRALERKKKRVKELEAEIASGEAELLRRRDELKQDPGGNWAKLADLARQEQALAKRVEAAMTEWMALCEELGGGSA